MIALFLKTLNMSIAAGWLILAVALVRLALKKAPKWITVLLWGIVALRLVIPFSFESIWSLIPSAETVNVHNIQYETPVINSGIPAVNNVVNPILGESFAPNPANSVNPLYVWTFIVSVIWLIGIAAMLLYALLSYVRIRRRVAERVPYEGDIFLCDQVQSPFILGLIRPKIYLPSNMDAMAMQPVIAHEKAHLTRRDHWWKPLGFLILAIHWFNPLCWAAYVLLCRDIELACDEKVIGQMDLDGKKHYSSALLECSTGRRRITICPLAFGEVGVKQRVKNVLTYKKPTFWIIAAAVVACVVVIVCFATNPKQKNFSLKIVVPAGSREPVVFTQEEVSPLGRYITVASGEGLGDTEVSLKPVEVGTESVYDEPTYLTPGMPVKLEAEKGGWFKIGVNVQNDTDEDIVVYLDVKNVNVRISDAISSDKNVIDELKVKYPEYFELGTFKGLEVYVWQMAEDDYRFGLMQGTNREKTLEEKMALKGATAEEMALILSTYDIDDQNIFVIPWTNPISSYLPYTEDMSKNVEYINNIRAMLDLEGIPAAPGRNDLPNEDEIFDALNKLDYKPYTNDGLPEYRLMAGDGTVYSVNFSENWVWRNNVEQADLSAELIPRLKELCYAVGEENNTTAESITVETDPIVFPQRQIAIYNSVLGHNRSTQTPVDIISCCSFVTLQSVSETQKADSDVHSIIFYGWALYEEYKITDNGLESVGGSYMPVALTFEYDDYGYSLVDYWEPRDGSYYVQDIRDKFPTDIAEDAIDSQKYILQQMQECYAQAVEAAGLDTDKVIKALIDTICTSPALSSLPEDYIEEHPIEYRELTYYGSYTLKYCFSRFEEGNETGLAGQIMARACEEIAAAWGEAPLEFSLPSNGVLTGQMWYSAFKNNALSLIEQNSETQLAERYPASYLLLSMLGKV